METITDAVLAAAASPWVYSLVFVLTVLDAFLVVVPSETAIVALAALAADAGAPDLPLLITVAAAAATIGDSLTYLLGRAMGTRRYRWMARPRVTKALDWATEALERRAATILMTARFIPFARIAVNLTAGASGFAYRRFVALTAVAGACWAVYNVAIGAAAGAVFAGNPVLAVAASVAIAVALGLVVDRVILMTSRRAESRAEGADEVG